MRTVAMLVITLGLVVPSLASAEMTAEQIVDKSLNVNGNGFREGKAQIKLVLTSKGGDTRVRTIQSTAMKEGSKNRVRILFLAPADVKGTGLLIRERGKGKGDLQYLYLPALKKIRRISGSAKNSSFMGTDFTYADLENREIKDNDYKRMPDESYRGTPCYRIVSTPKPGRDDYYSKVDMLIAKSNFVVLKADFYDKSGSRLKEMKAGTVEKVEGRWVVRKLLMKNVQKGTKTLLTVESITYSPQPPLQSSMFTKESLKQ
ncbi:MAG: outer membrane lipoprotein-sorting protein [Myxococcales bacterium]|nr:outer membrane lipoprotein-sorting protein [Myxococcales bacterium]